MNDDLRARLADILTNTPASGAGALPSGEIEALLDAMMPVIEERLWYAGHTHQGRCSWCAAPLDAPWDPNRQPHAHFMHCKYYTGPLGHQRRTATRACMCGRWWPEDAEFCPDAGEIWRGSLPARGDLR